MHNVEGRPYTYGETNFPRGKSFAYQRSGKTFIPVFEDPPFNTVQKEVWNQLHHFHYDAWLQEKYPNLPLANDRTIMPCLELRDLQHKLAHEAGNEWLARHNLPPAHRMKGLWKNLEIEDMNELAQYMLKTANSKIKAHVPQEAMVKDLTRSIHQLKNKYAKTLSEHVNPKCRR